MGNQTEHKDRAHAENELRGGARERERERERERDEITV